MSARMRLRRADGRVYLDRWGVEHKRIGGVFVHKMSAPDPGIDLHDHPWWFASLILWGGYSEERANIRVAPARAQRAEAWPSTDEEVAAAVIARAFDVSPAIAGAPRRGDFTRRPWLSLRTFRLDECHRISRLYRKTCWTLVIHGPTRRPWGFYLPTGWMHWQEYDRTVRAERRDLFADISSSGDPRVGRKS